MMDTCMRSCEAARWSAGGREVAARVGRGTRKGLTPSGACVAILGLLLRGLQDLSGVNYRPVKPADVTTYLE